MPTHMITQLTSSKWARLFEELLYVLQLIHSFVYLFRLAEDK